MLLGLRHMLGFLGDKHWGTQLFMICARWCLKQQLPVPALKKVRNGEKGREERWEQEGRGEEGRGKRRKEWSR